MANELREIEKERNRVRERERERDSVSDLYSTYL